MNYSLCVFVFSYNRGIFLENCLKSVELCLDGVKVIIIDDSSTDPDTLVVLSKLSDRFEIIYPKTECVEIKTGGLYANMNYALYLAYSRNISRVLFIQDDMQIVRKVDHIDFEIIDRFFEKNENCVQFQTCFRRRDTKTTLEESCYVDVSKSALIVKNDIEKGKDNFSATGVFDVERTRKLLGSFVIGEGANSALCREKGIKKPYSLFPFMNWLPYPSSYRGKVRTLRHRIIEYLGGSGFHPINYMSDKKIDLLFSRDPLTIPVAEEWLFSKSSPRNDFWSTAGGEYNLIARRGVFGRFWIFLKASRRWIKSKLQ